MTDASPPPAPGDVMPGASAARISSTPDASAADIPAGGAHQTAHPPPTLAGGDAPDDPARRRARPWRASLVGWGLLLAGCFFLPAIVVCNSPLIPARELYCFYHARDIDLEKVIYASVFYAAAYAFGLVVALGSAWRLMRRAEPRRRPWVLSVITLGSCVLAQAWIMVGGAKEPEFRFLPGVVFGLIALVTGVYLLYASLQHPARRVYLGLTFGGAVAASVWFGLWTFDRGARYGVVLSFVASLGLMIGTIGEARALTRRGWLRTLWAMLLCRLPSWEGPKGRCPACDYLLYGLREMRCPECGRPFTAAEVGPTPEDAAGS